jgi:hypothetical protein
MAGGKGWQIGLGGLAGAGAGASVGSLVGGPVGTGIGAGVGAVAGLGAAVADWKSQERADDAAIRQQKRLARDLSRVNANYDAQMAGAARAGGQRQLQAGAEGEMAAARVGLNAFQTQTLSDQARGAAAEQTGIQLAQQAGVASQIAEARRSGLVNEYTAAQSLADNAADDGSNYMGVIGAIGQAAAIGMGIKGQLNQRPTTMDQRRAIGSVRDANRTAIDQMQEGYLQQNNFAMADNEYGDPGLDRFSPEMMELRAQQRGDIRERRVAGRDAIRDMRAGFAQDNTLGRTPQRANPEYQAPAGYAGRDINIKADLGKYMFAVDGYLDQQIIADGGAAPGTEGPPVNEPVSIPPGAGNVDDGSPLPAAVPGQPAGQPAGQNGAPVGVPAAAPVGSPGAAGAANSASGQGSTGSPPAPAGAASGAGTARSGAGTARPAAPAGGQPARPAAPPAPPAQGTRITPNQSNIDIQGNRGTTGEIGIPFIDGETVQPWAVSEDNGMAVYDSSGRLIYAGTDPQINTGSYGAKPAGTPQLVPAGQKPPGAPVDITSQEYKDGQKVRTVPQDSAEYGQADASNREAYLQREASARWEGTPEVRAIRAVKDEEMLTKAQTLHQSMMKTLTSNGLSPENARAIANTAALQSMRTKMRPELEKLMAGIRSALAGDNAFYNGMPISKKPIPGPMNDIQDLIVEHKILQKMLSEIPAVDGGTEIPMETSDELEFQWRDLVPHVKVIPAGGGK